MLTPRIGLAVEAAALFCVVVAFVNRNRERGGEIEGVYFNQSVDRGGESTFAVAPAKFDILDPYLWLGAAVALALVGACVLLVAFRARRSP